MLRQQRRRKIAVPADRSLRQLWKEGYKQREFQQMMLRLLLSAINVDQIAERLEGIEGDTQRYDHVH